MISGSIGGDFEHRPRLKPTNQPIVEFALSAAKKSTLERQGDVAP